ncbi:DUF11 domain-containing protein [Cellulomonas sp. URHD0024]|uniref:DUF6923 family protein n=1 Tax=Cellulomonas sp. URHD0024 TaxID=1302620 RepID=UPI000408656E|nr:DUF11 domain-containing protein [Cellulomonas sp. URHD0024]
MRTPRSTPLLRGAAIAGITALLATGLGIGASAAPVAPAYPTVFISQVITGDTNTTMRRVAQSRLANAGAGGVQIVTVGSQAAYQYNALGYRTADGYLYAVGFSGSATGHLVQVDSLGAPTDLGAVTGMPTQVVSGAFGDGGYADTFFLKPLSATSALYKIDMSATTRTVTSVALTQNADVIDFTWLQGYLWGVENTSKDLVRISPTGTVTKIATGSLFTADGTGGSGYGAAWTYGNGNLGFSHNATGTITQVAVTNPTAAAPTVALVSRIVGPATSNNDGTTTPSSPTDLSAAVTTPPTVAPGDAISWTVTLTDEGPGGSSGGTFSFPVPTGVTGLTLPSGCTTTSGVVQCVSGPLADGDSDTYDFTATAPSAAGATATSTITVVGNELDPVTTTSTLTITTTPAELVSSGAGTAAQTKTVTVPGGSTLALLDDDTPVTTLTVPGGTFTVVSGILTFTPELGFTGSATADYTVTSPSGETIGGGTYTATVMSPAGPGAAPLTSTGTGTSEQQVTLSVPTGGTATLLDADDDPAMTLTTSAGTFVVDETTGVLTFTPALGFVGEAEPVDYRVTDAYGQSATSTYTPTVTIPAGPSAAPRTSVGYGTATQSASVVSVPVSGSIRLLDAEGGPATSVTSADGTFTVDPATGTLSFTPRLGFTGTASAVNYQLTDAYGQTATSTYTPTVLLPAGPAGPPRTTSGIGTAVQSVTLTPPTSGTVTLVDAQGDPATSVIMPGQGTYTFDPATGVLAFIPVPGFDGAADPASFRVTDAYGQTATGTYTPTVVVPPLPAPPAGTTRGTGTDPQQFAVPVPVHGSVTLLDANGNPTTSLTVTGGSYTLDGATGTITFVPVSGFAGTPQPVDFQVTDEYGTRATSTYTPRVVAPATTAPAGTTTGTGTAPQTWTPVVPAGGSVTLVDSHGNAVASVTTPAGTYTLGPDGVVVFEPVLGFQGTPPAVVVRVVDAYGQVADGRYAPVVTPPAGPTAAGLTSTGPSGVPQSPVHVVAVPVGGSATLLDSSGSAVTSVTFPGEGTYTIDPATGALVFTPVLGFVGTATPVTFEVTDAYGQKAVATYTAEVLAAGAPAQPLASSGWEGARLAGLALLALLAGICAVLVRSFARPGPARSVRRSPGAGGATGRRTA